MIPNTTPTVFSRKQLLAAQKDLAAKGDQSQKLKEQVGKAYNIAAAAYKSSHR